MVHISARRNRDENMTPISIEVLAVCKTSYLTQSLHSPPSLTPSHLHHSPHSQPLSRGTISERENLRVEVVLLYLSPLSEVPTAHSVIQRAGPELGTVGGDIDAARTVRVALKLAD